MTARNLVASIGAVAALAAAPAAWSGSTPTLANVLSVYEGSCTGTMSQNAPDLAAAAAGVGCVARRRRGGPAARRA